MGDPPRAGRWAETLRRLAPIAVWSLLLVLLVMDLRYVALHSSPLPRRDDIDWVNAISPDLGLDAQWLWSTWNEHRLPLPRLIGVALVRSVNDLRAALYFDIVLLGAMAAAMVVMTRRLRGRTELTDAAFPFLLLSPGGGILFLALQNITYLVPLALLVAILLLIGARRELPGPRRGLAIGMCACLLPLCGGPGLSTVPVMIPWMWAAGRKQARAGGRAAGNILIASSAATALVIALYFIGFKRNADFGTTTFADTVNQATRFLAIGLGPVAKETWPWSCVPVILMALAASSALVWTWRMDRRERERVLGIAVMLIAATSMAVAVAKTRGAGLEERYVPLATYWWTCALFACMVCAPRTAGRLAGCGILLLLFAALPEHWRFLREDGAQQLEVTDTFSVDLHRGLDVDELVRRYPACIWRDTPQISFSERMHTMHAYGMWPTLTAYAKHRAEGDASHRVSPSRIEGHEPVSYRRVDGKFVLVGPVDFALHCERIPGTRRFEGSFGVHSASYERHPAERLRFTIEALRAGASELLFERTLQAGTIPADRGFQSFSVDMPAQSEGAELLLKTVREGPAEDGSSYAFWTALRMH